MQVARISWARRLVSIKVSGTPVEATLGTPGARFLKVPKAFRARKAISKTLPRLFCEASLFMCCKGNKNLNNCKVSCLETPLFWRYKENYVTRNTPEKFRDFRETGPRTVQIVVSFAAVFREVTQLSLSFLSADRNHSQKYACVRRLPSPGPRTVIKLLQIKF